MPPPPPFPGVARVARSTAEAEVLAADVVPVIYEGMDDSCSICQHAFEHGQRVCRLSCRHMFHAECWGAAQGVAARDARVHTRCPNCRGAGTLIAIWDFIDPSRVTQLLQGVPVPNLLTSGASFHSMSTPMLTPRSARSWHTTSGGSEPTEPRGSSYYASDHFHAQTRLPDGRPALIVDPGSVGNLCGDKWAREVAIRANRNGHRPSYEKRPRPLQVSGVGHGSQACNYDCRLPVSVRHVDGHRSLGELTIPAAQNSEMPGLLGGQALRNNRGLWDFSTDRLYFLGPGDYNLEKALPPGTDVFQLERAPSGHSVLPCCEYSEQETNREHTLTLLSRSGGPPTEAAGTSSSSSGVPPPPAAPPALPVTAVTNDRVTLPPSAAAPAASL